MFKKKIKLMSLMLILVLTALLFTGCATFVGGFESLDKVTITSEPSNAKVYIYDDDNNAVFTSTTPATVKLQALYQGYNVVVQKEGFEPYETRLEPSVNPWFYGNILFAGAPGMAFDGMRATAMRLPNSFHVDLNDTDAQKRKNDRPNALGIRLHGSLLSDGGLFRLKGDIAPIDLIDIPGVDSELFDILDILPNSHAPIWTFDTDLAQYTFGPEITYSRTFGKSRIEFGAMWAHFSSKNEEIDLDRARVGSFYDSVEDEWINYNEFYNIFNHNDVSLTFDARYHSNILGFTANYQRLFNLTERFNWYLGSGFGYYCWLFELERINANVTFRGEEIFHIDPKFDNKAGTIAQNAQNREPYIYRSEKHYAVMNFVAGIEYNFASQPLTIALDFKPTFEINGPWIPYRAFYKDDAWRNWNIGLALRYNY